MVVDNDKSLNDSFKDKDAAGAQTTVWVGGLPENVAEEPSLLTDLMQVFGKVVSVTVRLKEGELKSWAFITFAARESADKASDIGGVTASDAGGKAVRLIIKKAQLDKELSKESTGALAGTWSSQEAKVAAAVSIQRMVRRSRKRQEKRGKPMRRRSSVKE